jgi:hypothetical protein
MELVLYMSGRGCDSRLSVPDKVADGTPVTLDR